ncbi:hypothetical protein [Chryseobacterium sp.]|uniref:hypothetical protein n=1 Tax=Chryseobacterium sp. TaxID=1871047 RepID=UPI0025C489DD|nr:hypothetical protein [Chryseobacterium sp.]MBV8325949.1 hypothetical protein [Chryseobacterium sp.]
MKNLKIILLVLLTVAGQYVSAQTEVKKPKEVFELFFDTFLKNDDAVRMKLNDYLRPTVEGQDAYQVDFKETSEEAVTSTTEGFLAIFPKAAATACKKEAEEYVRLMFDNFRKGQLMIKSVKVVPNEYVEGQKIAELTYTVSFKVPSKTPAQPGTDPKKVKAEDLKKYLAALIDGFKNADKVISTDQKFSLYELKEGDKIYYWNGSPDEIVTNLTDFYFDSFN